MDALRVAGNLLADDAGRIRIVLGTTDAPDGMCIDDLDIERTGRRAIMRTNGPCGAQSERLVHDAEAT
jgi:hypothetical protein